MNLPDTLLWWTAGATGLFAILYLFSRALGTRYPRVFRVLWLAFFLKLLVPFGFWFPGMGDGTSAPVVRGTAVPAPATADPALDRREPGPAVAPVVDLVPLGLGLWAAGTLAFWGLSLRSHRRWTRGRVAGPAVVGVLRPRMVLPPDFRQEFTPLEQSLIVAHEEGHLRSGDPFWMAAVLGVAGLFWWFAPVWLARREFLAVTEMACDARVLGGRDRADVRTYGELLVRLASGPERWAGSPAGFAGSFPALRRRVAGLGGARPHRSLLALVLGVGLAGGLTALSLVPMQAGPGEGDPAPKPAAPAQAPLVLVSPLPSLPSGQSWISFGFGPQKHPLTGKDFQHEGTDWAARPGTPVRAVAAGTVTKVGFEESGLGVYLDLDHGQGLTSRYAHLNQAGVAVVEGQAVLAGQTIAGVGSTGLSTGPHLHWEIRIDGEPRDPLSFEYR